MDSFAGWQADVAGTSPSQADSNRALRPPGDSVSMPLECAPANGSCSSPRCFAGAACASCAHAAAPTLASGQAAAGVMDSEVLKYARWLSIQATETNTLEQKVHALSKRTAAEMKRAERERGELARRLEPLEQLCQQISGGIEERLGKAREAMTADVQRHVSQVRSHVEDELDRISGSLSQTREEARSGLDDLHMWRKQADRRLTALREEVAATRSGFESRLTSTAPETFIEQLEARWEVSLSRERREVRELLSMSCGELTGHLNALREELLEQRRVSELISEKRLEVHSDALGSKGRLGIEALGAEVEAQMAELGGKLASRLQAKLATLSTDIDERVGEVQGELRRALQSMQEHSSHMEQVKGLHGNAGHLQELVKKEADQVLDVARDEVRTVHLEVMSVDTRVAAIEERLQSDVKWYEQRSPLLSHRSPSHRARSIREGREEPGGWAEDTSLLQECVAAGSGRVRQARDHSPALGSQNSRYEDVVA